MSLSEHSRRCMIGRLLEPLLLRCLDCQIGKSEAAQNMHCHGELVTLRNRVRD